MNPGKRIKRWFSKEVVTQGRASFKNHVGIPLIDIFPVSLVNFYSSVFLSILCFQLELYLGLRTLILPFLLW